MNSGGGSHSVLVTASQNKLQCSTLSELLKISIVLFTNILKRAFVRNTFLNKLVQQITCKVVPNLVYQTASHGLHIAEDTCALLPETFCAHPLQKLMLVET